MAEKQLIEYLDLITDEIEDLSEMANAYQQHTGQKGVFYFSNRMEVKNRQSHALGRVKFLKDGVSYMITIKLGKDGKRKVKSRGRSDPKIVQWLQKFVELNELLLWAYWNADNPEEVDSSKVMAKFKKVSDVR